MKRIWYLEQENTTELPPPFPESEETAEFTGLELTSSAKTSYTTMTLSLTYVQKPTLPPYINTHTK